MNDMFNAPNRDFEVILAGIPEPYIAVAFKKCPPYFKAGKEMREGVNATAI